MSERISIPALRERAIMYRGGGKDFHAAPISPHKLLALVEAAEALDALVDDYEETDPFPTSDGHPLYRARAARDRFDFGKRP